ncbi:autotransporter outer membrane beta-barrel domain-containing protein [Bordetella bronchialis]|uniref:Autotransporter domain-containing protein n=1 Tax=Bordetella bronchialis TaxID=463025 RepID=A0ABN4R710_9BORD|nr:autotransporter outer membrane beta-barrel domain-containing protein [Bordetella bronchialis]ANN68500.1 hypothetical protein BAU06_21300 [Bordetella bronchialis]
MFQRIRPPGGNPVSPRGTTPWFLRALYGATSFSLIATPAHADGDIRDHGASRATVHATDGKPQDMMRVRGPVVTQGHREHGVLALEPGAALLSGAISTAGDDAYAVYYGGTARVTMHDVDIVTRGARAHGVQGFRGHLPAAPDRAAPPPGARAAGQAGARPGDQPASTLALRQGTITLHGPDSVGVETTSPVATLGRPLRDAGNATLWAMGYTRPASAHDPDLRIQAWGERNVGVAIQGQRRLEMNGVGMDLRNAGAVGMSVGPQARVDGKNVGIAASGPGSFGLRVRGGPARRGDAGSCPVPTSVNLAQGHIVMSGRDAPAVELVRAQVALRDVSIATAEGARFAVGNEAGLFRMEGQRTRASLRAQGSALAAWTSSDRETAAFDLRNVSVRSESESLLEVGRDRGDSGPALPARVDMSLRDSDAQGRIWSGSPQAPRVDIALRQASSWRGSTDIAGTVTVDGQSGWQMDAHSTVDDVSLDTGAIVFQDVPGRHVARRERDRPGTAEKQADVLVAEEPYSRPTPDTRESRFHRLHVLKDIRGKGEIRMRADVARGESDMVVVDGSVHGDITVAVRDTGKTGEPVTSIELFHAGQGGPANYTLPNRAKRVYLGQQPFELHKETAPDDPSVSVWLVPEGAPFVRGHATLDLPPARGDRVIAEIPAGVYSASIDAPAGNDQPVGITETPQEIPRVVMHLPPPRPDQPVVIAEAPPETHRSVMHLPPPGPDQPVVIAEMPAEIRRSVMHLPPPGPDRPVVIAEMPAEIRRSVMHLPPPGPDSPVVIAEMPAEIRRSVMHLPPPESGQPIVIAEMPAGYQGTVDAISPQPPGGTAGPPSEGPPPRHGGPERKTERDTVPPPGGPRPPTPDHPHPPGCTQAPCGTGDDGNDGNDVKTAHDTDGDTQPDHNKARDNDRLKDKLRRKTGAGDEEGGTHKALEGQADDEAGKDETGGEGPANQGADKAGADNEEEGESEGAGEKGKEEGSLEDSKPEENPEENPDEQEAETSPATQLAAPPPPIVLSPAARIVVNNAGLAAGQAIWNAQRDAVGRRLRALRDGGGGAPPGGILALDAAGTGVWIDAADARQKIDNPLAGPYRQHLQGFVAGIDRAIDVAAGRWHIGLLAARIHARRDFDDGKGDTHGTHIGGYATFLGSHGGYASAMVTAGRYRHRMHGKRGDDANVAGAFRNKGAGASLEAGKRIVLPPAWFVEPHVGVDYLRVGGARYRLDDGTSVRDRGGHSLQWRTGARVGRVFDTGNGGTVTPYLRAGYAYEAGNRNRVSVDGASLAADLGGSRVEAGAGVEARLGKGHSVYVDIGYAKGRRFEQSRMVTAGFQYRW